MCCVPDWLILMFILAGILVMAAATCGGGC